MNCAKLLLKKLKIINMPRKKQYFLNNYRTEGKLKMFELFDQVKIISKNKTGTIVDIRETADGTIFEVESNVKGLDNDGYGGIWPIYTCKEHEIEKE